MSVPDFLSIMSGVVSIILARAHHFETLFYELPAYIYAFHFCRVDSRILRETLATCRFCCSLVKLHGVRTWLSWF